MHPIYEDRETMNWHWPQWAMALLILASFLSSFGEPPTIYKSKKEYLTWNCIDLLVMVAILMAGGFWG